jgi:transposase
LLAEERRRKRQDLLAATEKELDKVVAATQRVRKRLSGKEKIGVRLGRVINKYKMAKHFKLDISEESFTYHRRQTKIAQEAALDGIYIIRTDVPKKELSTPQAVRTYKQLSRVERAFRCMKTIDLHVRPIYHYNEERVRAHVFLCMLAYYVEWHMRLKSASILFDDDDPETAEQLRESEVAPAQRSPAAIDKAASKRTSNGLPVHSFRTLLADLSTIVLNFMQFEETSAVLELVTEPTAGQQRALDLLEVKLGV